MEVREIHLKALTVYKMIPGSCAGIKQYNELATTTDTLLQPNDWRGMYTQFQREHVMGTLPYRWEKGDHTTARLVAVTFHDINVVILSGETMYDGGTSGVDKANLAKEALGISLGKPLLESLGERGKLVLAQETIDEWELIIPHNILPTLNISERDVVEFKRHGIMPITASWRSKDIWHDFSDCADLIACIPDLETPV